jgi:hypothetical protein
MRRGLMKDLANTPSAMACGWQLYGDLERLADLADSEVLVDLLTGDCAVDGVPLVPPLVIAEIVKDWAQERHERDDIPDGFVHSLILTIRPRIDRRRRLHIVCSTVAETQHGTFSSSDEAFW